MTVVRGALTHGGRSGVGVSVAGNGLTGSERWVRRFLIFDTATSRLIGYRELSPRGTATKLGGDRSWADYLAHGSVALDVPAPPPPKKVQMASGATAAQFCAGLARP